MKILFVITTVISSCILCSSEKIKVTPTGFYNDSQSQSLFGGGRCKSATNPGEQPTSKNHQIESTNISI